MPVLIKLNQARKQFHARQLKKTGHNKFAGYNYFELADFLIPALEIFESLNLSAVVSFGVDLATMTLTDLDDASQFVITSPMSTASLKACHEVQNLGAVQTYLRRYLWVAALEIVEHDAIDSSEGAAPKATQEPTKDDPFSHFNAQQQKLIRAVAATAIQQFGEGSEWSAFEEVASCIDKLAGDDYDRRNQVVLALNVIFKPHSALRAYLKDQFQQQKEKA